MEIITRQQAIALRLNKYFTGVPCKRGHICERYTQMSSCLECLHPKIENEASRQARREALVLRQKDAYEAMRVKRDRQFAKGRLERLSLGVYTPSLNCIRGFVYALTVAREPSLLPEDTRVKTKPWNTPKYRGPNTYLHGFKLFREDFNAVIELNKALTDN